MRSIVLLLVFICWVCNGELLLYHNLTTSRGEWIINGTAVTATTADLICDIPDCVYLYNPPSFITYVGVDGNGLSTKSYTDIQLTYSVRPVDLERDDSCNVLYSLDKGRSWSTVASFTRSSNDVLQQRTDSLSAAADSDTLWVRFEIDSVQRSSADFCVFDEMYVNGTPIIAETTTSTTSTTTSTSTASAATDMSIGPTHHPTLIPAVKQTIDGGGTLNGQDEHLTTEDETQNALAHQQPTFWNSNWQYFMIASVSICLICTCVIVYCLHRTRGRLYPAKAPEVENDWCTPHHVHIASNHSNVSAEIIFQPEREHLNFSLPSPPSYTSNQEVFSRQPQVDTGMNLVAMPHHDAYDQVWTAAVLDDGARPMHTLNPNQAQHGEESIDALPLPSSYTREDGERDLTNTELQPMAVDDAYDDQDDDEWDDAEEDEELYNLNGKSEGRATDGQQQQHAVFGAMHMHGQQSSTAGMAAYQADLQSAAHNSHDDDDASSDNDDQYEQMYQGVDQEDEPSSDNDEYDKLYHKPSQTPKN